MFLKTYEKSVKSHKNSKKAKQVLPVFVKKKPNYHNLKLF
jgi:hypothetical protein